MRIVRTIGQAFEVCHRLSVITPKRQDLDAGDKQSDTSPCSSSHKDNSGTATKVGTTIESCQSDHQAAPHKVLLRSPKNDEGVFLSATTERYSYTNSAGNQSSGAVSITSTPQSEPLPAVLALPASDYEHLPLSVGHQWQLMRLQLDQREQQTRSALAQCQLLTTQLASETAARREAQERVEQLLHQNRQLLEHINSLVGQLQQLETKLIGIPQQFSLDSSSTDQPAVWSNESTAPNTLVALTLSLKRSNNGPPTKLSTNSNADGGVTTSNRAFDDTSSGSAVSYQVSQQQQQHTRMMPVQSCGPERIVDSISVATVRTLLPNTSPSRQQLSLSLRNNWTPSAKYEDIPSNRSSYCGETNGSTNQHSEPTTGSDFGSSGHSSLSFSPGDQLDQFSNVFSPLSDTQVFSPTQNGSYIQECKTDVTDAARDDIPRIEPPPKSRKTKQRRASSDAHTYADRCQERDNSNNDRNITPLLSSEYSNFQSDTALSCHVYVQTNSNERGANNSSIAISSSQCNGRQQLASGKYFRAHRLSSLDEEISLA